jgi:serine protease Do
MKKVIMIFICIILSLTAIVSGASKKEPITKPWVGIQIGELTKDMAAKYGYDTYSGGALIHYVCPGSPAEQSGLQSGDIIIAIDGDCVSSPKELAKYISKISYKQNIMLTIIRNSKKKSYSVTVINNPYGKSSGSSGENNGGKPWFGLNLKNVTKEMAEEWGLGIKSGVLVLNVYEGSPAEKSGVKKGDIIVEVDGVAIKTYEELLAIVTPLKPGKTISLGVWNNKKKKNISITF